MIKKMITCMLVILLVLLVSCATTGKPMKGNAVFFVETKVSGILLVNRSNTGFYGSVNNDFYNNGKFSGSNNPRNGNPVTVNPGDIISINVSKPIKGFEYIIAIQDSSGNIFQADMVIVGSGKFEKYSGSIIYSVSVSRNPSSRTDLVQTAQSQNRQPQSAKIIVYSEIVGTLLVNEKKDGFKATVGGSLRTNPVRINSSGTFTVEVDGYTGDKLTIGIEGPDWKNYYAAEVVILENGVTNYKANITNTGDVRRNQIHVQLMPTVSGRLRVSGINEEFASDMPQNVTADRSVSFIMFRMNGQKFQAGSEFTFFVEDEQGKIYESENPLKVRSDNYIQYQVSISPNQTTNTNLVAQAQSTQAYHDAHTHFELGRYNEAITGFQKALDLGGLDKSNTVLAQGYISWAQRILSSREAAKNLRDADFTVKQNTDNTITIERFDAPGGVQTVTYNNRQYSVNSGVIDLVVPSRLYGLPVTVIGPNVFKGRDLHSVVIPDTVITIGESAFAANPNLNNVKIGNRVRTIGDFAFMNCPKIKEIIIPNSVIEIGRGAFTFTQNLDSRSRTTNKGELTNLTLGNGIQSIGSNAFRYNSITNINLPSSLRRIDSQAFQNNPIKSVVIRSGITNVGEGWTEREYGVHIDNENAVFDSNPSPITLPANMSDSHLRNFGFSDLINFYTSQNRAAGTYVKNGPIWSRQ